MANVFGKRTLFDPPFIPPGQILGVESEKLTEDIKSAADEAYQSESKSERIPLSEVPRSRRCRTVASAMMLNLFDIDEVYKEIVGLDTRGGWEVDEHRYVTLGAGSKEELVADPTWQQFLSETSRRSDLPNVLIGSRDGVVDYAGNMGISLANQRLWMPRHSVEQPPRQLTPAERVAAAVDATPPRSIDQL